ncbi:hypothetical protein PHYPSEUDO_000465 [Phytophthora pseudosyringae]|uniref:RING-type domain-containing protein n=1 Tax=Phytophthora pseudosyringae TaxID=221518 RepID=A0A8T1V7R7_9STRA|nr:hypothetical protein PHYPSEUDO_000465 [Phytophthora pseudosyringae]
MPSSDAWSCPICLGSFERPVLVSCCGQSFCRSCLDDALRQADACPMCRSPLLSGPFSVTSNRALGDALAALASNSPRRPETETRAATSFVDAAERKLTAAARDSEAEVHISVPNAAQAENREASLIQDEGRRVQAGRRWGQRLSLCRCRAAVSCRRRAANGRRVNWASLQCVFYVALFFAFVFFLRVQEDEFAVTTGHLRRPN